jgi:hypothetical protein
LFKFQGTRKEGVVCPTPTRLKARQRLRKFELVICHTEIRKTKKDWLLLSLGVSRTEVKEFSSFLQLQVKLTRFGAFKLNNLIKEKQQKNFFCARPHHTAPP